MKLAHCTAVSNHDAANYTTLFSYPSIRETMLLNFRFWLELKSTIQHQHGVATFSDRNRHCFFCASALKTRHLCTSQDLGQGHTSCVLRPDHPLLDDLRFPCRRRPSTPTLFLNAHLTFPETVAAERRRNAETCRFRLRCRHCRESVLHQTICRDNAGSQ